MFDHERLEVYQMELRFITWVTDLMAEVRDADAPATREVRDHLDRASLSALLNTAEGNGHRQPRLRARYFGDACGSAVECAACLDALVAKRAAKSDRVAGGKEMLLRIVQMLSKLLQVNIGSTSVREQRGQYEGEGGTADYENDYDYDPDRG